MLDQWLNKKLQEREQLDLLRTLPPRSALIDFTSNDYLGLARNAELRQLIKQRIDLVHARSGSTGSRLLSGNSELAMNLEEKLAGIFRSQTTLLFNSGYSANLAVLSSIPQKDDTIIYDELSHASIKDGARLSLARKYSFRHNDLSDLERKILRSTGRVYVAVESVYSMDGDSSPLRELTDLSRKHGFAIILDEAHTTGVKGPHGAGASVAMDVHNEIDIRIYTFGKAMGVCGACVAGSRNLISYLINFARPFIYTTAPSPADVVSVDCSFEFLAANASLLQKRLEENIKVFLSAAGNLPNGIKSTSAIQTYLMPGNKAIRNVSRSLQAKGFDVRPILSPTVPKGLERLRICLHTFNTAEEIIALTNELRRVGEGATVNT